MQPHSLRSPRPAKRPRCRRGVPSDSAILSRISVDIMLSVPVQIRSTTQWCRRLAWIPLQEACIRLPTGGKTSTSEKNLRSALEIPSSDGHDRNRLAKSGPSEPAHQLQFLLADMTSKWPRLTEPNRIINARCTFVPSALPRRSSGAHKARRGVSLFLSITLWPTQSGSNTFRRGWETS